MTTSALWELAAARFMVAQLGVIVGLVVCAALGSARAVALLAVCLVTVASAARLPMAFAAALSVAAWGYFTGFAVNRYGELTFTAADLARLALLLGCAVAAHWRR